MIAVPDKTTRQYLRGMGHRLPWLVRYDRAELHEAVKHAAKQHPEEKPHEHRGRAIARLAYHNHRRRSKVWLLWLALTLLAFLIGTKAHAQYTNSNISKVAGTPVDATGLPVKCLSGCGGGGTVTSNQGTAAATANAWPVTLCNDTKTTCVTFTGTSQNVNVTNGSIAVTGTFWQSTQPVSGPLTDTQLRATAVPVSGTFFQSTQPVSAASLPLPSGAAQDASLATLDTDVKAAQPRKMQDANGNAVTVKPANTPAALGDTALVVTLAQQQQPPILSQAQAANPLLFSAAMKQFCRTNLCPGVK